MRLGIYADLVYRADNDGLSTDRAFILFLAGLAERVDELVLFGRLHPQPGRAPYALSERMRFVGLPHYARVEQPGYERKQDPALKRFRLLKEQTFPCLRK